jgi:flagellar hook assembly protein FlgD
VEATEDRSAITFLGGAEPNPFGDRVTFRWGLRQSGAVDLAIFDVQGRLVRTLVRGPAVSGTRVAAWDGRDEGGRAVSSGVYVLRMEADRRTWRQVLRHIR